MKSDLSHVVSSKRKLTLSDSSLRNFSELEENKVPDILIGTINIEQVKIN